MSPVDQGKLFVDESEMNFIHFPDNSSTIVITPRSS
jgi:hypothetical protein